MCPSVRSSVVRPSIRILCPNDNLSKHQWIFTKLDMCIDIVESWFGIANEQISSKFDGVICPETITREKCQRILTKLGICIDIKEI